MENVAIKRPSVHLENEQSNRFSTRRGQGDLTRHAHSSTRLRRVLDPDGVSGSVWVFGREIEVWLSDETNEWKERQA